MSWMHLDERHDDYHSNLSFHMTLGYVILVSRISTQKYDL